MLKCTFVFLIYLSLLVSLPVAAAEKVGVSSAVNEAASGRLAGGHSRIISVGDNIFHNERVATNSKGVVQILLDDGTTFTVGPNSQLTIDSFVYSPNRGAAKVAATVSKGVFRFIGALTSKTPHGVKLHTPVGTAGIRGAIVNLAFRRENRVPVHLDLLYGRMIVLKLWNGRTIHLDKAGYSIVVANGHAYIEKTPAKFLAQVQKMIGGTPGRHAGATTRLTDEMVSLAAIVPMKPGSGGGFVCRSMLYGKSSVKGFSDPASWGSQ